MDFVTVWLIAWPFSAALIMLDFTLDGLPLQFSDILFIIFTGLCIGPPGTLFCAYIVVPRIARLVMTKLRRR